ITKSTAATGTPDPLQLTCNNSYTAQSMAGGSGKTVVTAPDSSTADFSFNADARPSSIKLKVGSVDDAETKFEYEHGLVKKLTYPEGNSVTYGYDTNNSSLRGRANLLSIMRDPGT